MASIPESHRDLLDAAFCTIGTIDPDGYPQLTESWFLYDDADGKIKLSLNTARFKTKYLQQRPQCSIFLLELPGAGRWLEVRGRASITPDDDYAFAEKVGQKYGVADMRRLDRPGEKRVCVTVEPVRVNTWTLPGR